MDGGSFSGGGIIGFGAVDASEFPDAEFDFEGDESDFGGDEFEFPDAEFGDDEFEFPGAESDFGGDLAMDQAVVVKQESHPIVISPYRKERSSQQDAVGSSGGPKTNESLTRTTSRAVVMEIASKKPHPTGKKKWGGNRDKVNGRHALCIYKWEWS